MGNISTALVTSLLYPIEPMCGCRGRGPAWLTPWRSLPFCSCRSDGTAASTQPGALSSASVSALHRPDQARFLLLLPPTTPPPPLHPHAYPWHGPRSRSLPHSPSCIERLLGPGTSHAPCHADPGSAGLVDCPVRILLRHADFRRPIGRDDMQSCPRR